MEERKRERERAKARERERKRESESEGGRERARARERERERETEREAGRSEGTACPPHRASRLLIVSPHAIGDLSHLMGVTFPRDGRGHNTMGEDTRWEGS
jgi:hypothetical protein